MDRELFDLLADDLGLADVVIRQNTRLNAKLRKGDERTVSGLWSLIGRLVDIYKPAECADYFSSCGYEPE